ncbi:MAG TPA: hypothetical protein VNO19_12345 [Gemmatimonadales bacterium]|nr:hypothetical protein [Gemmatimonadales bacterium]
MTSPQDGGAGEPINNPGEVQYPTNQIIAILDTHHQTACAIDALVNGGFLESEVKLGRGSEEADRIEAGTGRRGFQDWLIRFSESIGIKNAESEIKDRYEQALREGATVIAVRAPTEERKDLAARILKECGGHFINFCGSLSVERIS